MGQPRLWAVTASLGAALVIASVLMASLHDHHWLISYDQLLLIERTLWWVQFTGLAVFIVGCIGLTAKFTPRLALFVGMAFVASALILPYAFGGYLSVLNVHHWTTVLWFPILLLFVNGVLLAVVGSLKMLRMRRVRGGPLA